jgi:hypothetical protein
MLVRYALAVILSFAGLLAGCQNRDAAKCAQGFDVTRQAIKTGDFALARQWREYAYKQCDAAGEDQASLATLDREISSAEAALKAQADAELQRKQQNEALLKLFVSWAGQNRAAPDKASAAPVCDVPADPAEAKKVEITKERFCTATRQAGNHTLVARFWQADNNALRFSAKFPAPVSCQDFGASVSKTWDVPSTSGVPVKRSRCEITSGPLSGMSVIVSAAHNADAYIVSPAFIERDPQTKLIAGG